jgi:hypothetical protein
LSPARLGCSFQKPRNISGAFSFERYRRVMDFKLNIRQRAALATGLQNRLRIEVKE